MTDLQPFDDERVSAYLDGELTDSELAEFEAILRERPDYAQAVEELGTMRQGIQALPQHRLPANFANRVLRRAERQMLVGPASEPTVTRAPGPSGRRWIAIGAMVLAASLLVMLVTQQTSRSRRAAKLPEAKSETAAAAPVEREADTVADAPVGADAKLGVKLQPARDLVLDEPKEAAAPPAAAAQQRELRTPATDRVADRSAMRGEPAAEPLRRRLFSKTTTSNQQLVEQAQSWQQQPEAVADEWDIVVATQLRTAEDWQQLNTALESNRLELDAQSVESKERLQEVDDLSVPGEDDFDAVAMNERLLNRMKLYRADRDEQEEEMELADGALSPADAEAAEADTYVLYVEGTPKQLYGLVNQLPNTGQLVNIKASEGYFAGSRVESAKSSAMRMADKQLRLLESTDDMPGRAANLGQSRLSDAMSATVRGRAKKMSSAWQQVQAAQTKPAADQAPLRGLIILQDVSDRAAAQPVPDATGADEQ